MAERFKIPLPKEGETALRPPDPADPYAGVPSWLSAKERPESRTLALSGAKPRFTPEQQAVEDLIDASVAQASESLAGNEAAILAVLRDAGSYGEAMQTVLELYPGLNMDELNAVAEAALFAADCFGRLSAGGGKA